MRIIIVTNMQRSLILLIFMLVVIFLPQTLKAQTKDNKLTAKESIKILLANGNILLDSIESCKSMKTEPTDKTILDYLSAIIANQAEPKTKTSLEYKMESVKGKQNKDFWKIELTFNNLDEESGDPWNVGFRFLVNQHTNKMVRSSLECIGT